jgi:hypothetical protein
VTRYVLRAVISCLSSALLCLFTVIQSGQPARAQASGTDSQPGVHFIVLVDDSGSIKQAQRAAMGAVLPELLYEGGANGQTFGGMLPRFQAGRDQISLVFFTILGGTGYGGCHEERKRSSALPDDMFELEYVDTATEAGFAAALKAKVDEPCRFKGNLSPILTAPQLILPYIQEKLPPDRLFSRTLLVIATDNQFNTSGSPADELESFKRSPHNVEGTPTAYQLSHDVSSAFHFDFPPDMSKWLGPVYVSVGEVTPLRSPDAALSYQRKVQLDRQAESSDRLRLVPEIPFTGDLRFLTSPSKDDAYRFRPLRLRLSFQDANGAPWKLGRATTLGDFSFDIADCRPPACVEEADRVTVPLFEPGGKNITIAADDPDLTPGRLRFIAGLRYQSRVYDHIYVETSPQEIEIAPTPPLVIPGVFGVFPDTRLDNAELASLWSPDADDLTSQSEANERLLARRNQRWALAAVALALLVAAVIFYLYRTRYKRAFDPQFDWQSAAEVAVDFNRPAASRLLAGTFEVVNRGEVPWFGRLWGNEEQPTRDAVITLAYDIAHSASGLKISEGPVLGFVGTQQEGSGLGLSTEEAVSHGKKLFVFLAAEAILDYVPPTETAPDGAEFRIPINVKMMWGARNGARAVGGSPRERLRRWLRVEDSGEYEREVQCSFMLKPEEARKPVVTYAAAPKRLDFKKGDKLRVGNFVFRSNADHAYARPFAWGDYSVQTYRGTMALGGEPLALSPKRVTVPPRETVEVPALIECDGRMVPNPDPVSDTYTFKLSGDFDASSSPGQYAAVLYRDPTRAEVVLKVLFPTPAREIFWTPADELRQRVLGPDGTGAGEIPAEGGQIRLDAQQIEFDDSSGRYDLLRLEVGNSASAGRGFVEAEVTADLVCDDETRGAIHVEEGRSLGELLGIYNFDSPTSERLRVESGEPPQTRSVKITPSLITRIEGAFVPSESLRAVVEVRVFVRTDSGEESRRELSAVIPFRLERLPGPNWLCVDYGTSAIAAAFGTGGEEQMLPIPLQDIRGPDPRSYADYDKNNIEKGSRFLLPSWVICDADMRGENGQGMFKTKRRGFPGYVPASLRPGDPTFVGLPATDYQFVSNPKRIIYSIKSWLGKSAENIPLHTQIQYEEDGHLVTRNVVPLEKVIESSFAALIEAYLLAEGERRYRADQIIICHPNTFTRHHREKLQRIAFRAFSARFEVESSARVHLISESDAAAYFHCVTQMRKSPRSGTERLLVYDFGAGTLDLSLIRIEWEKEPICHVADWEVLGRIGVPVAGNYIDEILARLIDRLLREHPACGEGGPLRYVFPVVAMDPNRDEKGTTHEEAVMRLWRDIRDAKHEWNGDQPFNVRVGAVSALTGVVGRRLIGEAGELLPQLPSAPPDGEVGFWSDGEGIYLSIPKGEIHDNDRMKEFQRFATETVIDELLGAAKVKAGEIDTILVTGRGALWPGLRDRVWRKFPQAYSPSLSPEEMKRAVVEGAIARQDLKLEFKEFEYGTRFRPRLGVLFNHNEDIFTEERWGEPVPLIRSPDFRLVQVNLANPNPREDMKSLRKHFYIDLDAQRYTSRERQVYIRRGEERDGRFELFIDDGKNPPRSVFGEARSSQTVTDPPWPVGRFLLGPRE